MQVASLLCNLRQKVGFFTGQNVFGFCTRSARCNQCWVFQCHLQVAYAFGKRFLVFIQHRFGFLQWGHGRTRSSTFTLELLVELLAHGLVLRLDLQGSNVFGTTLRSRLRQLSGCQSRNKAFAKTEEAVRTTGCGFCAFQCRVDLVFQVSNTTANSLQRARSGTFLVEHALNFLGFFTRFIRSSAGLNNRRHLVERCCALTNNANLGVFATTVSGCVEQLFLASFLLLNSGSVACFECVVNCTQVNGLNL